MQYFYAKLSCKNLILRQVEWEVQNGPITKNRVLPVLPFINSGYHRGRDLPRVPKTVVTFYRVKKVLLAFHRVTKIFCHKSLKIWGTKPCSYLIIDKKKEKREAKPGNITVYILYICFIYKYLY